ncbi:MAG TPA: Ig-like domain-containing protein [Armatimonadota bacterium]|jgi:hypothetical protein
MNGTLLCSRAVVRALCLLGLVFALVHVAAAFPQVTMTGPAPCSVYDAPASITVTADVYDDGSTVSKVEFYANGSKIGEDTTAPYSYTWTAVPMGEYWLTASATDAEGQGYAYNDVPVTVRRGYNTLPVAQNQAISVSQYDGYAGQLAATDADGDPLTYSIVTNGTLGTAQITDCSTGAFLYYPNGSSGADTFTFLASDDYGNSNTATVTVTITHTNLPPWADLTGPAYGTLYNAPASITLTADASDQDGTISKVEFYANGTKIGEDTTAPYSYTWTNVPMGDYNLWVVATDDEGAQSYAYGGSYVTVRRGTNTLPVAQGQSITVGQYETGYGTLTATDADGDPLTYSVVTNGTLGTAQIIDSSTGAFLYYPNGASGSDTFTFVANDGYGNSNTATVTVTITHYNEAPMVYLTSPEPGSSITSPVTLTADAYDYDGTVSKVEFYANGTKLGEDTTAPFSYTWTTVPPGTYWLSATATDNEGAQGWSYDYPVTVTGVNTLPVAVADTDTTTEDTACTTAVLTNDSGLLDTPLTVTISTAPTHGAAVVNANHTITYTPAADYTGADSYGYQITDGNGDTATATVTLTVTPVNDPPTVSLTAPANNATYTAPVDMTLTAIAGDVDGTVAKVEFYQGTTKLGEATSAPYSCAWTNVPVGTYTLTAIATDDTGATTTSAPITVTVQENLLPVAQDQTLSTRMNTPVSGTLVAADGNGDTLTYRLVTTGTSGTALLTNAATGAFTYTPNTDITGTDTLTFVANDGHGDSNTATVTLTILPPNQVPTVSLTAPADGAIYMAPAAITLTATAADSDGTISKVEFFQGTTKLGEATSAPYSYAWSNVPASTYTLTATATDNDGATTTSASVIVAAIANTLPVAQGFSLATLQNTPVNGTLLATDVNGDTLTFSIVSNGTLGTASITNAQTGAMTYTPNTSAIGTDSFTFRANDGQGNSNIATVTVTIQPIPITTLNFVTLQDGWTYLKGTGPLTIPLDVQLTGAAIPFEKIVFTDNGQVLGERDAAGNGTYAFPLTVDSLGAHHITVSMLTTTGETVIMIKAALTISNTSVTTTCPALGMPPIEDGADCWDVSMSADGNSVIFVSDATNLVANDTNTVADLFVLNRQTGAVGRLSVGPAGVQANGVSWDAAVSADGRYVAFASNATNLVAGDTNGHADIFVRDRLTQTTTRVSMLTSEDQVNGNCWGTSISADGNLVTFVTDAPNLAGSTEHPLAICIVDRAAGTIMRVSSALFGDQIGCGTAISANGQFVVYDADDPLLVPNDNNEKRDVFIYNPQTFDTERVSLATDGTEGNGESWGGSVSADGRYVAFISDADNLVTGDTNGTADVFVRDRQTNSTIRISPPQGNDQSWEAKMTDNGRYVFLTSDASNLVGDTNQACDIFRYDLQTGQLVRISRATSGAQNNGDCWDFGASADGQAIAFIAWGTDLVVDVPSTNKTLYVTAVGQ